MLGFDEIFEILYKAVFIMLFRTFSKKALFIAAMFLAAPAVAGTVGGEFQGSQTCLSGQ